MSATHELTSIAVLSRAPSSGDVTIVNHEPLGSQNEVDQEKSVTVELADAPAGSIPRAVHGIKVLSYPLHVRLLSSWLTDHQL